MRMLNHEITLLLEAVVAKKVAQVGLRVLVLVLHDSRILESAIVIEEFWLLSEGICMRRNATLATAGTIQRFPQVTLLLVLHFEH